MKEVKKDGFNSKASNLLFKAKKMGGQQSAYQMSNQKSACVSPHFHCFANPTSCQCFDYGFLKEAKIAEKFKRLFNQVLAGQS